MAGLTFLSVTYTTESLLFLLVPQCSALIIKSGGREVCTMGVGVYLAGAVLVGLIVYCGYQLSRMLFPVRFEAA
jgi:hypothetical protein